MRFWLCANLCFMGEPWCRYLHKRGDYRGVRVLYQPHGDLFGARALSGKRFSGGEQLLCLCLSWDAVGVAIKVVVRYLPPGSELEVIGLATGAALAFQLAEAPELASVDTGVLSLAPAGLRISSFGAFSPFTKLTYFTKFF